MSRSRPPTPTPFPSDMRRAATVVRLRRGRRTGSRTVARPTIMLAARAGAAPARRQVAHRRRPRSSRRRAAGRAARASAEPSSARSAARPPGRSRANCAATAACCCSLDRDVEFEPAETEYGRCGGDCSAVDPRARAPAPVPGRRAATMQLEPAALRFTAAPGRAGSSPSTSDPPDAARSQDIDAPVLGGRGSSSATSLARARRRSTSCSATARRRTAATHCSGARRAIRR